MQKRLPPPNTASPLSRHVVDTIIKRKAPPSGPPPSLPLDFKPKSFKSVLRKKSIHSDESSEADQDDEEDHDSNNDSDSQSSESSASYRAPPREECKSQRTSSQAIKTQSDLPRSTSPANEKDIYAEKLSSRGVPALNLSNTTRKSIRFIDTNDGKNDEDTVLSQQVKKLSMTSANGADKVSQKSSHIFKFSKFLRSAKNRQLKQFLLSPVEEGITVRCYIERDRFGANILTPIYTLCADLEDGTGQDLMACKKVMLSRTPHYVFSVLSEDFYKKRESRSKLYLGKLRSANTGDYVLYCQTVPYFHNQSDDVRKSSVSGFSLYDEKDEEKKDDSEDSITTPSKIDYMIRHRQSIFSNTEDSYSPDRTCFQQAEDKMVGLVVRFNSQKRPTPVSIRGCEVGIPNPAHTYRGQNIDTMKTLSDLFNQVRLTGKQNEDHEECYVMHERKTKYDPLSSCLVDYHGRANIASIKNFQLVASSPARLREDEYASKADDFMLQLGKTTEDCFNLDVRYPLSPFQAFATCIARFDAKLSWKDSQ